MILSLTLAITLLVGGYTAPTGDTRQQNNMTAPTTSGEQQPPPDNDARAQIVDLG